MFLSSWLAPLFRRLAVPHSARTRRRANRRSPAVSAVYRTERLEERAMLSAVVAGAADINFTENASATPLAGGLTVTDSTSSTLQSAQISMSNYTSGQDVLAFTNNGSTMGNITVASNTNGVLNLTSPGGTATVAQWQDALRAVTYVNTSDNPLTTPRTVSITVNDGTSVSDPVTSNINITAVNDAAVLGGGGAVSVNAKAPGVAIATGLTLSDVDSSTEETATIKISNYVSGQDMLSFTNDGSTMGNISVMSNTDGTMTLVSIGGTATLAQWRSALRSVTYANTSATPNLTPRTVTFEVGSGTSVSNSLSNTVNVGAAASGGPVLSGGANISFTENGSAMPLAGGLTVTDSTSGTLQSAQISLSNYASGQDTLAFTNNGSTMGNIAVSSNANGVMTLTSAGGTATLAQWQAALRAVTYVNTSDNPLTIPRTVSITVNDGTSISDPLTSTINVTAVNDAAVLSGGATISVNAKAPAVAISTGLNLSDVDSATEEKAVIKISNYVAGQDELSFTNDGATMGNIAVASNSNGVLTLMSNGGSATLAQWQAALRAVTYANTSSTPNLTPRTVTFEVDSGTSVSNLLNNTINVGAALTGGPVLSGGANISFTENGSAMPLASGLTVTDTTHATLSSAQISMSNYVAGQDTLAFTNNGSTMGNIAVTSNSNGVLTLTSAGGTATLAQWQAALRAVTYVNTSDNPITTPRNISITANDGTAVSAPMTSTINVTAVNDAAVLSGGGTVSVNARAPGVAIATGLNLTDVDSTSEETAVVKISNYVAGQDMLSFTNDGSTMGNIAVTSNTNGVLTLTSNGGSATLAQWQAALRAVTYANTSTTPNLTPRTITFQVNSGTSSSNLLSNTVNVGAAASGGPVLAGGANISFTENGSAMPLASGLTITDSTSTTLKSAQISLSNYAAGQDMLAFTNNGSTMGNIAVTSNTNGVLTLTSAGGTATLAQWQAALRAVTYVNTSENPMTAPRTLSITVNDGTSVSDPLTSTINVTAVNDAAVLSGGGNISVVGGAAGASIAAGINLTDVDSTSEEKAVIKISNYVAGQDVLAFTNDGSTMGNIAVTSNSNGVLTLTSNGGSATLAQWQAALRAVTYANTSTTPNLTTRNITFQVDSGLSSSNALASTVTVSAPNA